MSELNRAAFTRAQLYFDVIQMRVLQIINSHFVLGNSSVHEAWIRHYNDAINSGVTEFSRLAMSSFKYTNRKINKTYGILESNSDNESDMSVPSVVES